MLFRLGPPHLPQPGRVPHAAEMMHVERLLGRRLRVLLTPDDPHVGAVAPDLDRRQVPVDA
jgi:hypothetical protein